MLIDVDDVSSLETHSPKPGCQLAFDHLSPLLVTTGMISFIVEHVWTILLTDEDIARCLRAWPNIASLVLNPAPVSLSKPLIAASSLADLSPIAPQLHILGLHLDFTGNVGCLPSTTPFPFVTTLSLGMSLVDSPERAVQKVQMLFPGLVKLRCEASWSLVLIGCDCPSPSKEVVGEVLRRRGLWESVKNLSGCSDGIHAS
jgi:hypothetical protein